MSIGINAEVYIIKMTKYFWNEKNTTKQNSNNFWFMNLKSDISIQGLMLF